MTYNAIPVNCAILPEIGTKTTKKWEYRDFLGNIGIFWELTWDFYKSTVGNAERDTTT
jgi:hypothetical protein